MIVKSKNYGYFDLGERDEIKVTIHESTPGYTISGPARVFVKNSGRITIQSSQAKYLNEWWQSTKDIPSYAVYVFATDPEDSRRYGTDLNRHGIYRGIVDKLTS